MSAFKYFMKSEWQCVRVGATVNFSVGVKGTVGNKGDPRVECVCSMHGNLLQISLCCKSDGQVTRPAASHRSTMHKLPAPPLIHGWNSLACYVADGLSVKR